MEQNPNQVVEIINAIKDFITDPIVYSIIITLIGGSSLASRKVREKLKLQKPKDEKTNNC